MKNKYLIYPQTLRKAIAYLSPDLIKICSKYDQESFLHQAIFVFNVLKIDHVSCYNQSNQLLKTPHV
jgi:hypothetical protein